MRKRVASVLLRDPCITNCLVTLVDQGLWRHHAAMLLSGGAFAEELPCMDPCNGSAPATGDIHLHIFKAPRMAPHTHLLYARRWPLAWL